MTPKTSWLTEAIIESVDFVVDLFTEIMEQDMELGILEAEVPQEIMRQRFEEAAQDIAAEEGFIQDFGEAEWLRQASLALRRNGDAANQ